MTAGPSTRRNLAANFLGQGWRGLMALAFVPFYIRILGVEAYGLIGLYASLQLALALLDAGLRPTLAREMARFTAGARDAVAIRTLLRSVELPLLAVSGAIILVMLFGSHWLASHWVNAQHLSASEVTRAFQMMGVVAAMQFLEAAYDSCLNGLQRQVLQNVIITCIATLRGFGALVVLWLFPTLTAFFAWQAGISLLSCALLGFAVYRSLPTAEGSIRFSLASLRSVRRFAAGMFGIALLSLLLTQSDKFILARFMPLSDVGHYALAGTLTGAVAMLSGPIGNTFYPRLTQLTQRGDTAAVAVTFHRLSSLMAVAVGSAAAMLIFFGQRIIELWIRDGGIAAASAPILALLALSGLFNSLTALPYLLQLSNGVTGLTLRINLALLVVFVPVLVVAARTWGGIGAASCAAGLNLAGMMLGAMLTFRRFLPEEAARWWLQDILRPLAIIFSLAGLLSVALPRSVIPWQEALCIAGAGCLVLCCAIFSTPDLRREVFARAASLSAPRVQKHTT